MMCTIITKGLEDKQQHMAATKVKKYWGYAALLAWGAVILTLGILRMTPYGIDEVAARSLILDWSIVDRVANPIAFFGIPDFRLLLLAPAAVYWTGSIMAAKVWMMLLAFAAVTLLYRWSRKHLGDETALVASGIVLIAPFWLLQIEALSAGPLLILLITFGAWLDGRYLESGRVLGGWYFMHMVVVAAVVSLHPAGLAYPLAVAWLWRGRNEDKRRQRDMYIGLGLATIFILLMWAGWKELAWFSNPFTVLGQTAAAGFSLEPKGSWWLASFIGILFLLTVGFSLTKLRENLVGLSLFIAVFTGGIAADASWGLILMIFTLYYGLSLLIDWNDSFSGQGLFAKRGVVMVLGLILGNAFLLADKTHRQAVMNEQLDSKNELIRMLSFELESMQEKKTDQDSGELRIASEWPGRTMLVLRRPILPLPPSVLSDERMTKAVQELDMLLFSPDLESNANLINAIANRTDITKTLIREKGGVVVGVVRTK